MKKKEIFLTSEGFLELENELHYLKTTKRNEVIKTLKDARALGDLSENSEYDQAREEQANLEKRIIEVEYALEHAVVIDSSDNNGKVGIGCQVELQYEDEDDVETYKIVGSQEADPFNNKISNESPMAIAIMGKKVGETVEVSSPDGVYSVKIVAIG
jgi:transcription elongation factor GreA